MRRVDCLLYCFTLNVRKVRRTESKTMSAVSAELHALLRGCIVSRNALITGFRIIRGPNPDWVDRLIGLFVERLIYCQLNDN